MRPRDEHVDAGVARRAAPAVHATEPLHHPLVGDQIAYQVIGVQVDADFAGRRGDQKGRRRRRELRTAEEAVAFEPPFQRFPLVGPALAYQQLTRAPGAARLRFGPASIACSMLFLTCSATLRLSQ